VDFLLVIIKLFSLSVTAQALRAKFKQDLFGPQFPIEEVAHQPFFFSEN